jgi:ABC-type lipoprotein release transport system permease subunit
VNRVLLAAVALVLLIPCVSIAALMMVRSAARSREIAIRTAMGASHGRITAQLLVENVVLAMAGAVCGVPLGAAFLRVTVSRMPNQVPPWITFTLDWRLVMFGSW